jgi:Holliday junction resolvase RusA-like endonuclease
MENNMIFIKGNVPSSKNSRINTKHGSFASKTVKNYLNNLGIQSYSSSKKIVKGYVNKPNLIEELREEFLKQVEGKELPLQIGFHFVRDSRRNFDFHNIVQVIADLFTAHDFLNDDCMKYFIPIPLNLNGEWYSYDKENPGVYIKILNNISYE